jgi:ligand-binding sensor domain-containing protein
MKDINMKNLKYFFTISIIIFYSSLNAQWIQVNDPFGGQVYSLAGSPNVTSSTNLFAGTEGGIFLSTNDGTSWKIASYSLNTIVFAIAISDTNLFVGNNTGVLLSKDNGTSWTEAITGLDNKYVNALAISSASGGSGSINIFAATNGGIFKSTDNGTSWTATGNELRSFVFALTVSSNGTGGSNLFAGISNVLFLSINDGINWTAMSPGLSNTAINTLAVYGTTLYAGTDAGVFVSTDKGSNWTDASTDLTNTYITALAVSGTNLFAGTGGNSVWRRPLAEIATSIEELTGGELPANFKLKQNYPNPFNPSTVISYQIPATTQVSLKVYDIIGNEVAELVNKVQPAGKYEVTFNAADLPSGIYFYQLRTDGFDEVKKMTLLK